MGLISELWFRLVAKITGKRLGKIKKKWVFNAKSSILNSALIYDIDKDGKPEIIFGTKRGILFVLNQNGKVKWKASLRLKLTKTQEMFVKTESVNAILASPVIAKYKKKKVIIACTTAGIIAAFYANGKLAWDYKIRGGIETTPLVEDIDDDGKKEIIFGSTNNFVYVLSDKGKLLWKYNAKSKISAPPAFYPTKTPLILIGTEHGYIKALTRKGKLRWKYKTQGRITAKPAVSDIFNDKNERIIVGSGDNSLYVLDHNGNLDWQYRTHGSILSEAILGDIDNDQEKEIFFGSADDSIYALAPNSQKIWSYETDFWIAAAPLIADIDDDGKQEIIAGSYDKSIYVLEGKGTYQMHYLPGLSIIVNQPGHFTPFITQQPGELIGKKIWQLHLNNIVTGLALMQRKTNKQLIVSTKEGKLIAVQHER